LSAGGGPGGAAGPPAIDPSAAPPALSGWLERARVAVERELDRRLPLPDGGDGDPARRLVEAMRYAALGPGKRLRPALAMASCEAAGGAGEGAAALAAAAAVELLHSYTLVHDDLPAMDDDDLRRGRPTVHRAFDEAIAVLAGDGLLTAAFGALADLGAGAAQAVRVLARRCGSAELLAGQALDLAAAARAEGTIGLDELERIHAGKTGALFAAACELGAVAAGADPAAQRALADYGMALGIAFQHADDLDDGDFAQHRAAQARRRADLGREAAALASRFGERGALLASVARWVGGVE
jgi:geranylgeranyl pyrophosphate synthase